MPTSFLPEERSGRGDVDANCRWVRPKSAPSGAGKMFNYFLEKEKDNVESS
ncbi:hypothetical protein PCI56_03335 [Plesiomonas shigelloides subsp. oncorhynchi]|nr:hypothetical protein [Plesiomonas shigelloides]